MKAVVPVGISILSASVPDAADTYDFTARYAEGSNIIYGKTKYTALTNIYPLANFKYDDINGKITTNMHTGATIASTAVAVAKYEVVYTVHAVSTINKHYWICNTAGTYDFTESIKQASVAYTGAAADTFAQPSGFTVANGDRIALAVTAPGDTIPSGASSSILYYAVNSGVSTFQLSTTLGGSALNLVNNGTVTIVDYNDLLIAFSDLGTSPEYRVTTVTPNNDLTNWQDNGAINLYKFLDKYVSTQTQSLYASCTVSGDTITATAHGISANDLVRFTATTMPTGLVAGQEYYAVSVGTNTFKVAETRDGTPVTTTTSGTSVQYMKDLRIEFSVASVLDTIGLFNLTGNKFRVQARTSDAVSTAFTVTSSLFTATAHGLGNGEIVVLSGALPNGLTNNYVYYVIGATADTFQLSTTLGGTALACSNGSGYFLSEVFDSTSSTVYDTIVDYDQYFFDPISYITTTYMNLPYYAGLIVTVTVTGNPIAGLGAIAVGKKLDLGVTLDAVPVDFKSYVTKTVSQSGDLYITKYAETQNNLTFECSYNSDVLTTYNINKNLRSLDGVRTFYIGDERETGGYELLLVYGILDTGSHVIASSNTRNKASIKINSLT